MTIPLIGNGSLYKRLGHLFGRLADLMALQGGTATARVLSGASQPTTFATIEADYADSTQAALYQVIEGIQQTRSSFNGSGQVLWSDFQTRVQNTIKAMYLIDQGLSANLSLSQLTSVSLTTALVEICRQMNGTADSVNSSTVAAGAQTAQGSPVGTPIVVASVKDVRGLALQYAFPETLTIQCTADSQAGSATAGNEPFTVRGQAPVSNAFDALWPGGSGVAVSVNAVDGSKNYSTAGNLLTNSDFATATTANNPDNWTIQIGSAGTDVFQTTSGTYTTGGGALQFTGTGGGLLDAVTQSFNTTPATTVGGGGTSYALLPSTVYHVNGWCKVSATPTTGVLQFSLIDGSAYPGTVINDDQGTANTFTKSLTAVSTSYVNFNGAFRTPASLSTTTPLRLRVRLSTAIDSGKSVYIGRLSMTPATQIYAGGPYISVHSGATKVVNGVAPDTWTLAITNTWGTFQQFLERTCALRSLGLVIPNSGSPTIADSLVA